MVHNTMDKKRIALIPYFMDVIKESTGMSVLRPIANQRIDEQKRKRIWCEKIEAWGFFSNEDPTEEDIFLLCCNISIGDRVYVTNEKEGTIFILVGIWKQTSNNIPVWTYRLLGPNGYYFDLNILESRLFKQAWKS